MGWAQEKIQGKHNIALASRYSGATLYGDKSGTYCANDLAGVLSCGHHPEARRTHCYPLKDSEQTGLLLKI